MPGRAGSDAIFDRVLKALDVAGLCSDEEIEISIRVGREIKLPSESTQQILSKGIKRVVRKDDSEEERYVLGIVLEPLKEMGTNDVQQDTYSAANVRKACYGWMEDYGTLGLQHQIKLAGQVKVLENWIAPDDCVIGGQQVVKGTWLMGVRVIDDNLWQAVKDGTLTGFSIGGKAQRVPLTS